MVPSPSRPPAISVDPSASVATAALVRADNGSLVPTTSHVPTACGGAATSRKPDITTMVDTPSAKATRRRVLVLTEALPKNKCRHPERSPLTHGNRLLR